MTRLSIRKWIVLFSHAHYGLPRLLQVDAHSIQEAVFPFLFLIQVTAEHVSVVDKEWVNDCIRQIADKNGIFFSGRELEADSKSVRKENEPTEGKG
jgi:hypothetical protein